MKTLQLSTNKLFTYYLTSITEEQKIELFEAKKNRTLRTLSIKWELDCDGILKVGETDNVTTSALSNYVESFKGKDTAGIGWVGHNREIHYRNYTKTLEEQKRTAWLINQCQDTSTSVKSALKMMDEKWCILWEVKNKDSFKEKMDNLLKDKLCTINNL